MTQKRNFGKVAQQLGKRTKLAIVAMLIVGAVNAQKPKLAVMDFMAGVGLYQNDVNGLSDMLINSLFNTGRFELIERGQLCELIGETNLQKSSLSAGQLQQLAIKGVNFLLLGTVNLTGGEFNIDVRVVDVGTGQLYSTAGVTKLSTQTYRDMMPKLANELATKLPQTVKATVTVIPAPQPQTQVLSTHVTSGDLLMSQGKISEACGEYDSAILVNPNDKVAYLKLAEVYKNINSTIALDYLKRLVQIDQGYIPAYALIGDINYENGTYDQALDAYEKFVSVQRVPSLQHERFAQLLFFTNQYQKSLEMINQILERNPENLVMRRLQFYNNFELGNYALGLEQAKRFIQTEPQRLIAQDFIYYGHLLNKNNDNEGAIRAFNKALSIDPENETAKQALKVMK